MSIPVLPIIDQRVRDAALLAFEAGCARLGIPSAVIEAIRASDVVDDLLVEAFAAQRVDVTAVSVGVVDTRPA